MIFFSYVKPVCFNYKAHSQTMVEMKNDCDWNHLENIFLHILQIEAYGVSSLGISFNSVVISHK